MTTKAEREAAYQALVKRGVPIPPEEIDAVLEAAEGARGVVVEARAPDQNSIEVARSRAAHQSELKALWKEFGGGFHGPHVEHASIPETGFWLFLEEVERRA